MRVFLSAFASMLVWSSSLLSAPSVTLPAELKANPGRLVKISAQTTCPLVRWINSDPDNCDLVPSDSGLSALFTTPIPGKYRVWCYTALADVPSEPAMCVITVGTPQPPVPPPPTPDELTRGITAAWAMETSPTRGTEKKNLASLYRQSVGFAQQANNTTWGSLFSTMSAAAGALDVKGKLPLVQAVIQQHLQARLPHTASTPLDQAGRDLAGKVFTEVAQALEVFR